MATRILTRLEGVPETTLDALISSGFFKTKNEAIRAGIIGLGKEFGLLSTPFALRKKIEKAAQSKKHSFSALKVMEKLDSYES